MCVRRAAVAGSGPAARLDYRPRVRPVRPGAARRDGGRHQSGDRADSRGGHRRHRRLLDRQPRARHLRHHGDHGRVRYGDPPGDGAVAGRVGRPRAEDAGRRRAGEPGRHRRTAAGRAQQQPDRRQPVAARDRRSPVELPQLHRPDPADSRNDAQPRHLDVRGRPGGGQRVAVAAERLPARRHVQQRRSPRRQPGHPGARRPRQHRGIPGAGQPVQLRVRRRRRRDHQHGDPRRHQRFPRPRLLLLPRREPQRPRQVPARRPAQAVRADPAGRLRRRRPDRPRIAPTSSSPTSATTRTSPARRTSRRRRRRWR